MNDKILKYNQHLKLNLCQESVTICADGKKLYRVFQNIIDNALKYALSGTRIYIETQCRLLPYGPGGQLCRMVEAQVKNTAGYEMDFSPEEIMERFARGDKARTTNGSGLGLSIAQSFTQSCGGTFHVVVDGDQFKSVICFPLVQPVQPAPPVSPGMPRPPFGDRQPAGQPPAVPFIKDSAQEYCPIAKSPAERQTADGVKHEAQEEAAQWEYNPDDSR